MNSRANLLQEAGCLIGGVGQSCSAAYSSGGVAPYVGPARAEEVHAQVGARLCHLGRTEESRKTRVLRPDTGMPANGEAPRGIADGALGRTGGHQDPRGLDRVVRVPPPWERGLNAQQIRVWRRRS